ncbi:hypothetical protein Hamer_G003800 [Homarus americanus]|uniref:Uncharacterized protein n=1 Tax=Homarus americanus TaxID=6706 RepID=A0A8J5NE02_HOMAM|nr:hypothetical protein Hamer_G003800 [Homarus americanus]
MARVSAEEEDTNDLTNTQDTERQTASVVLYLGHRYEDEMDAEVAEGVNTAASCHDSTLKMLPRLSAALLADYAFFVSLTG